MATQFHAAGPYVAPDAPSPPAKPSPFTAPAHCRLTLIARPSAESEIEIAAWLPLRWNGKLLAVGNGAWGGVLNYQALLEGIRDGYATVATDTGHKGLRTGASFAIGHPEKLIDFGSRAVHEMAVHGKNLVTAFYSRPARYSYFSGCSTGGRQGLVAAQRYPRDFDGIVAGSPVIDQARLRGADIALLAPGLVDPATALTAASVELVHKAVVNACDADDGVTDGIVDDPRACKVDHRQLACKAVGEADCLTAGQLATVTRTYAPVVTPAGQFLSAGKWPGSEPDWPRVNNDSAPPQQFVMSFQIAYGDEKWDWRTFDPDRDLRVVDTRVGPAMNAVDTDLSAFKSAGGKLLLYHAAWDGQFSPTNTIDYYEGVIGRMRGRQSEWLRLFIVPGSWHCGGGPGPHQIDFLSAVDRWREIGEAPDQLLGVHVTGNRVDMTRPVCAYPKRTRYKGTGSTNDASNFRCQ